ncbi:hypothetical protein E2562_011629 [Oryza meyeriana var. granulata]|uniref:Uncharacterized protein n=1 Tax=Oryza meyeriana var. granulata TaxID=110450 RepID=A0A6G1DWA2_9ORYZ|nr:hypothetical protein E2562_011629 [Oryza meyeriana var. granulata]
MPAVVTVVSAAAKQDIALASSDRERPLPLPPQSLGSEEYNLRSPTRVEEAVLGVVDGEGIDEAKPNQLENHILDDHSKSALESSNDVRQRY